MAHKVLNKTTLQIEHESVDRLDSCLRARARTLTHTYALTRAKTLLQIIVCTK